MLRYIKVVLVRSRILSNSSPTLAFPTIVSCAKLANQKNSSSLFYRHKEMQSQ